MKPRKLKLWRWDSGAAPPPKRETAARAGTKRDGFLHSLTAQYYPLRVIRTSALGWSS